MKLPGQEEWSPARVQRSIGFWSYLIESGGKLYRRNRRQLRTAPMEIEMREPESVLLDVSPSKVSQSSGDTETPMLVPFMQMATKQRFHLHQCLLHHRSLCNSHHLAGESKLPQDMINPKNKKEKKS